jgi:hypothetical protein
MSHYSLLVVNCSLFIVLLSGCGGASRPADLPPLYPLTITVTQDGKALPEAVIKFVAQADENAKYKPVAITGADGKVALSTYGFPGVPAGTYKVTITKNVDDDFVTKTDDAGEKQIISYKTYRTVEAKFSDVATTPFEIEVSPKRKNSEETFDVGKAVREKM